MIVNIYALVDPRDNSTFYVGRTKNSINARLARHIAEAETFYRKNHLAVREALLSGSEIEKYKKRANSNARKNMRIIEILNSNHRPIVKLLDQKECPTDSDAARFEEAWIAKCVADGHFLLNYFYSHRMRPEWYKKLKKIKADTPDEYIAQLHSGEIPPLENEEAHKDGGGTSRQKLRRYGRRAYKRQKNKSRNVRRWGK